MAVRYEGDINPLIHALERRGYRVRSARRIAGAPGRTADIELENDVVVRWDAYSLAIWAEGASPASQRVERYLKHRFSCGLVGKGWAHAMCELVRALRYGRKKSGDLKVVCQQIVTNLSGNRLLPPERVQPQAAFANSRVLARRD